MLASTKVAFLAEVARVLLFLLQLNGKIENWPLLLSQCRYLIHTEMFLLSKPLNLIGCYANRKAKFPKNNIQKPLQKQCFILLLVVCLHCCGNLKFPLAYNGKRENWYLLLYFYLLPWQLKV